MRQNIDPLNEYEEQDCSRVLRKIGENHHWQLNTLVESGGKNFSQGQRQLIGLARAILRRSPIVIFDEVKSYSPLPLHTLTLCHGQLIANVT